MRLTLLTRITRLAAAFVVLAALGALEGAPRAGGQAVQQLNFSATPAASAEIAPGATNAPVLGLRVAVSSGSLQLSSLIVRQRGSATDADLEDTGVRIWIDANANDEVDGGEAMLDAKTLFGGAARLQPNLSLVWTEPVQLLVTIDAAAGATLGSTFQLAIDDRTEVVTDATPIVAGLPIVGSVTTIATAPVPPAPTGAEATGTGLTLKALDTIASAVIPSGAGTDAHVFRMEALAAGAVPAPPGVAVSGAYRFSVVSGAEPLGAEVSLEFDLTALLTDPSDETLATLRVVALSTGGKWRTVPATRSGETAISSPVSGGATLAVVSLPAGAAGVIPSAGGEVAAGDGSAVVTLPVESAGADVLVSLTPDNVAPTLPAGAVLFGAPLRIHFASAGAGSAIALARPLVLSLPAPTAASALVVYGLREGGPATLLPSAADPAGERLLIEIDGALGPDLTVALAGGATVGGGAVASGEAGTIVSGDGETVIVAGEGAGLLHVGLAPVGADAAAAAAIPATVVGSPIAVLLDAPNDRSIVLEVPIGALPAGIDPAGLTAFGVDAPGIAPRRLPLTVETRAVPAAPDPGDAVPEEAGPENDSPEPLITRTLVRVALGTSTTVYFATAPTRTLLFTPGWNLITLRLAAGTPSDFLATTLGGRVVQLSGWDAARGGYLHFDPTDSDPDALGSLQDGDVIWAYIAPSPESADATAPAAETPEVLSVRVPDLQVMARDVVLHPGWNLVSWSGPLADAATVMHPFWKTIRTAYRWDQAASSWTPFIMEGTAIGAPLLRANDRLWLRVVGDASLIWPQPGE